MMAVSLKSYIADRQNDNKIISFCALMSKVSAAIEEETRPIIRVNLNEIYINKDSNNIILMDSLFNNDDLDKTTVGINTGISIMADRKSTKENKRVSFALMVMGAYVNADGSAVKSDMEAMENFTVYQEKIPAWLREYFYKIFNKMDYETPFNLYYETNFKNKVQNSITEAFKKYELTEEQIKKIQKLIENKASSLGEKANPRQPLYGFYEEHVINKLDEATSSIEENLNINEIQQSANTSTIDSYNDQSKPVITETEGGNTTGIARVRFDSNVPKYIPPKDKPLYSESASSSVVVVTFVLALITIVAFVTFMVLKTI